ncbi:MAG: site-specific integrase [Erysipelotrichaceae bacterium]|nr:site-specific integrase [Erysipelotrichaceae bacterium]
MGICKRKKKNGFSYEVNFTYKENGVSKRYFKGGFAGTKEGKQQAQDHETIMKAQLIEYGYIKKECNKTFKQVYDEFLEIGANKYQANTIQTTRSRVNRAKELFRYPIKAIDHAMLQKFFNKRNDKGIEENKSMKVCLNRIFEFALDMDYITVNPISRVNVIGQDNHHDHNDIISHEDFLKLTTALDNETEYKYHVYSIAVKIGYYTGLRASEIFALERSDIDFDRNIIDVNKKLVYHGIKKDKIYASHQMKNKSSKASIPLFYDLRQALIDWFQVNHHDVIISDENGCYLSPECVQTQIKKYASKLDIDFHFHMLRHTLATSLVMNGVDVKTTQEILRHANASTTLNIYTHVNETQKRDALNRVFNKKCEENVGESNDSTLIN